MNSLISSVFDVLSIAFDKVPGLSKIKGYRSVIGLLGLAALTVLRIKGVGDETTLSTIEIGLLAFTGLALNAKTRTPEEKS